MKINKFISIFISMISLLGSYSTVFSQYYFNLGDNIGTQETVNMDILNTAAMQLVEAFPEEIQDSFKVLTTGFYLHNSEFVGGIPKVFQDKINEANLISKYYLLIGRESNETKLNNNFWIHIKLPSSDDFNCYNESYYLFIKSELIKLMKESISGNTGYVEAELLAMNKLKLLISEIIVCCNDGRTACSLCPEKENIRQLLIGEGFFEVDGDIIQCNTIDPLSNNDPIDRSRTETLIDYSEVFVYDNDTILINDSSVGLISDIVNNGFTTLILITSDLNCCFPNETSFRTTLSGSFSEAYDAFNTSSADIILWIHGSQSSELGDKIYIKIKSKVDSYYSTVLHADLNDAIYSSAASTYPHQLLNFNEPSLAQPSGSYAFNMPTVRLLSLVSEVPESLISQTQILKRGFGQFIPWYPNSWCGGGITLGKTNLNWYRIYLTENYFSTSTDCPRGEDLIEWLDICSHEVRHLLQIDAITPFVGVTGYIGYFLFDYAKAFGHDDAPAEQFAEIGSVNFSAFLTWIINNKGSSALEDLFNSNQGWVAQTELIQSWWNEYPH